MLSRNIISLFSQMEW